MLCVQVGDILISNDPYRTGTHPNDVLFVRPVFRDGRMIGSMNLQAHMIDMGGTVPGGFGAGKADVYANGLVARRPATRVVRRRRLDRSVLQCHRQGGEWRGRAHRCTFVPERKPREARAGRLRLFLADEPVVPRRPIWTPAGRAQPGTTKRTPAALTRSRGVDSVASTTDGGRNRDGGSVRCG